MSQQLIQDAVLPGLRSLQQDLSQVAPNDHANVVASMIREFSDKLDPSKPVDRWVNLSVLVLSNVHISTEFSSLICIQ